MLLKFYVNFLDFNEQVIKYAFFKKQLTIMCSSFLQVKHISSVVTLKSYKLIINWIITKIIKKIKVKINFKKTWLKKFDKKIAAKIKLIRINKIKEVNLLAFSD